jgi:hypothetical protein
LCFAPTQLPSADGSRFHNQRQPGDGGLTFLDRVIVKDQGWGEEANLLIAPFLAALIASSVAFVIAGRLRLQAGSIDETRRPVKSGYRRRTCGSPASAAGTAPAFAQQNGEQRAVGDVTVSVSKSEVSAFTGDRFTFTSQISNNGSRATPPLIANLAFVAIDGETYVDPEDWSPERTYTVGRTPRDRRRPRPGR